MTHSDSFEYRIEEVSPVEKTIHISFAPHHWQREMEQAYRKINREASLPGFRRGKTPRALLERHFRHQVEGDLLQELLDHALERVLKEQPLRLAHRPSLRQPPVFTQEKPLELTVHVETYPEVALQTHRGLSATKSVALVTEQEIDKALEKKRERLADLTPIVDRQELMVSDVVSLEVTGTVGTKPYKKPQLVVDVGQSERAEISGLSEALVGQPVQMKNHTLTFTIPTGPSAGQTARLVVTTKGAYIKHVPALDDEFAKDTGEAETLSALREKTQQQLQEQAEREARNRTRTELIEALIQANPTPLPPTLVQRVSADYLERRRMEVLMEVFRSHPEAQLQSMNDEQMAQATRHAVETMAKRDIAFQLLIDPIAQAENLEITEADVEKRLAEWAHQEDVPVSKIKAELLRDDAELYSLRRQLLQEKVLDSLESHATVTTKGDTHASV